MKPRPVNQRRSNGEPIGTGVSDMSSWVRKYVTSSVPTHARTCGLKIRVSVVQFHPWPPTFSGLALSSLPCVRQRRENVGHLLRLAPAGPTQSGPPQPLNTRLQTWRSDPPSRATSSPPGLSAHRSMFPADDATRPRYAANRGTGNYQGSPASLPHTTPSYPLRPQCAPLGR